MLVPLLEGHVSLHLQRLFLHLSFSPHQRTRGERGAAGKRTKRQTHRTGGRGDGAGDGRRRPTKGDRRTGADRANHRKAFKSSTVFIRIEEDVGVRTSCPVVCATQFVKDWGAIIDGQHEVATYDG